MTTRTTNERNGPLTTADTPSTAFPEGMQDGASAGPPAAAPAFTQVDTKPDERRLAIARAIVRLLSTTIGSAAGIRIELVDGTSGVPVMGDRPRATLRIHGPDAVGRMIWPPTPDSIAEAYLRGDVAQLLLARPTADGPAPRPLRPWW